MVYDAKTRDKGDWIKDYIWNALEEYRNLNEFKARSAKAKANRAKYKEDGKVAGTHTFGRRSAIKQVEEMTKEFGSPPNAYQLFVWSKSHKNTRKVMTQRAQTIVDQYNQMITQDDEEGSQYDPNQIYFETVGGPKKEKVLGTGNAQELYFGNNSDSSTGWSSGSTYTPGLITQLQTQQEERDRKMRAEYDARFQTQEEQLRKMQEDMNRHMSERLSQIHPTCNPGPNPYRDYFSDGGSGNSSFTQTIPHIFPTN